MPWTADDIPDQTGRTAVVTGANSGLGLEVATQLARHGARVVLACRDLARAKRAAEGIRATFPQADVAVARLDLADLGSVAAFAAELHREHSRVDLLVNNAGLMAIDRSRTVDGFETQFGVNHLGHFALARAVLDLVDAAPAGRVLTMSSMGHRAGRMRFEDLMGEQRYGRWRAYFQSKLANLLFSAELHRRLTAAGSTTIAAAAHPGGSRTDLGTEGRGLTNRAMSTVVPMLTQPVAMGALPMLRAATDLSVRGGQFYGPRRVTAGSPVLETPSRRARDADDAQRLWDVSSRLTDVAALRSERGEAARRTVDSLPWPAATDV